MANNNYCFSRVLYLELFYTLEQPRKILIYFTHGHSAKTQTAVSLEPLGSDTLVGRLRKAGMYPAYIYLSIFFIFTLFYLILSFC